ncbi:MAG: antitoxin [Pseudonocardiaceae bacterium]
MSLFSNARRIVDRARSYTGRNPDKVRQITDKAARFADKRTHGKYHRQIDDAVRKVDGFVHRDRRHGGGPHDRY